MINDGMKYLIGSVPLLLIAFVPCSANTVLTLSLDFVEQFKNKVMIDADFLIDKAHREPNPPEKDGDMHLAGRARVIGLPAVAEIENAAEVPDAVNLAHSVEGTERPIKITGVWRIWPEHGGEHEQVQFADIAKITTTNPPHVFEIHPVIQIGDISLIANLHPISGFHNKEASEAFHQRAHTYPDNASLTR